MFVRGNNVGNELAQFVQHQSFNRNVRVALAASGGGHRGYMG
jgi:hypothetical protein